MGRRKYAFCRPFSGCQPLGLLLGCVMLVAVVLIAISAVGIYAFTPTDLLQQYNDAVTSWDEGGMIGFMNQQFTACLGRRCTPLFASTNEEGYPPAKEYNAYTSLFYQTPPGKGILPRAARFECSRTCPVVTLHLSEQKNGSFVTQPRSIPIFAYKWTTIRDPKACGDALGLFWREVNQITYSYCVHVYVLDNICITVNQTASGKWAVSPYQITSDAGCRPQHQKYQGCGVQIGDWAYGTYTLVDGRDISASLEKEISVNKSIGNAALSPSNLPSSRNWTANLSEVSITLRSVSDPKLFAEAASNGTLYFTRQNAGTYAFNGDLLGFFGWSFFIVGIFFGSSTIATVIVIAIFFPSVRYKYLYKSQHPDTAQQRFYTKIRSSAMPAASRDGREFNSNNRLSGRFSSQTFSPGTSLQNIPIGS